MLRNRMIFQKYPILLFILAGIIVVNNIFKFAPGQTFSGFTSILVPLIFVAVGGYFIFQNKKNQNQ
jgi:hypothetical protein